MRVTELLTAPQHRFARRLVMMLIWLVVFDRIALTALRTAENQLYEAPGRGPFRFANNDLFSLGPLVRYLRGHPKGERRRFVFSGNSILYGYGVKHAEAVPAVFEQLSGDTRVFNAAMNGSELGTSFLVAKAAIDSVDGIFVQIIGETANPALASLIPVDEADVAKYRLEVPNPTERRLKDALSRVWRLYDVNDRLQAALFGTSTRQYLYVHKREILLRILKPLYEPPPEAPEPPAAPDPSPPPSLLRALRMAKAPEAVPGIRGLQARILDDFGELAKAHRKRVTLMQLDYVGQAKLDEDAIARFNAHYAPYAEIVVLRIPANLTYDGQHFTAAGCRVVAAALLQHETQRARERAAR